MDRHKLKLNLFLEKQIRILQKRILDLSEVIIPQNNYKPFRGKILSATNDMLRDLQAELDKNYNITYDPQIIHEDVVEIKPSITKEKDDNKGKGYGNTNK